MLRKVGQLVRYRDPVTGYVYNAKIQRVIKGKPVKYVLKVEGGGMHLTKTGSIAYSDEIWTRRR